MDSLVAQRVTCPGCRCGPPWFCPFVPTSSSRWLETTRTQETSMSRSCSVCIKAISHCGIMRWSLSLVPCGIIDDGADDECVLDFLSLDFKKVLSRWESDMKRSSPLPLESQERNRANVVLRKLHGKRDTRWGKINIENVENVNSGLVGERKKAY